MIALLQRISDAVVWGYTAFKDHIPFFSTVAISLVSLFSDVLSFVFYILDKVASAISICTENMPYIRAFIAEIVTSLNSFSSVYYPKINAYFPADFLFNCIAIYLLMIVIGVFIRTVKSFVPTVA